MNYGQVREALSNRMGALLYFLIPHATPQEVERELAFNPELQHPDFQLALAFAKEIFEKLSEQFGPMALSQDAIAPDEPVPPEVEKLVLQLEKIPKLNRAQKSRA